MDWNSQSLANWEEKKRERLKIAVSIYETRAKDIEKSWNNFEAMLKKVLHPYNLELKKIEDRQYVILKKTSKKLNQKLLQPTYGTIFGLILDERGEPLQGVNIYILASKTGTSKPATFSTLPVAITNCLSVPGTLNMFL
mgnify:CR=1 FL=1